MLFLYFLLGTCPSYLLLTRAELYSAVAGLEALVDTQKVIRGTLDHYIDESKKKVKELEKLKEDYENLFNVSSSKFQDFISNPINAFVLMKKLSTDWNETRKKFYYMPLDETEYAGVVYPDYEDLTGAAKALLRVQQTYALDTAALSDGIIAGAPKGVALSADDCFELGRQAFDAGYFDYAISWLEESRQKSLRTDGGSMAEDSEVAKYLKMSAFEKGRNSLMLFTSSLIQLGYMMSPFVTGGDQSESQVLENAESNTLFTSKVNAFDEASYRKLCQAKKRDTPLVTSMIPRLRCRLSRHHPYLKLRPVKEEELWEDPKVSIFYDIISDREIEIMKSLALPILERAEVAEYSGHLGHRVSDNRITKVAWLGQKDHPLISQMYRRLEAITGLSSRTAEPFQMANYGLGGHFHLHMDVLPDTEKYYGSDMGNRIATWLTYMSDVHAGGATVFPRLNLTVWPKKGAALFWHNVKSNGVGNVLTLHGACPVVAGSKWVTNVWFHERDQEFRLKCGKHPESALQPTGWFNKT